MGHCAMKNDTEIICFQGTEFLFQELGSFLTLTPYFLLATKSGPPEYFLVFLFYSPFITAKGNNWATLRDKPALCTTCTTSSMFL